MSRTKSPEAKPLLDYDKGTFIEYLCYLYTVCGHSEKEARIDSISGLRHMVDSLAVNAWRKGVLLSDPEFLPVRQFYLLRDNHISIEDLWYQQGLESSWYQQRELAKITEKVNKILTNGSNRVPI